MAIFHTIKNIADQIILKSVAVCALSVIVGGLMSEGTDFLQIFLMASVFGLITAGFNSLNGIIDIEADKVGRPERPIPSGRLKIDQAWKFTFSFFLLSLLPFAILLTSRTETVFLVFSLVVIDYAFAIFYSLPPKLKRIGLLANLIVGAHHTLLPMLVGWSLFKPLNEAPFAIFIALFFIAWGVHIIEDFEDMEGDRIVGIQTLPLLLGKKRSIFVLHAICSFSIVIGLIDIIHSYSVYWLTCLPQQLLIIFVSSKLPKTNEPYKISKIYKKCEILSYTIGLTLIIGYLLLG